MLFGFLVSVSVFYVLCAFIVNKLPGLIRSFFAPITAALIFIDPSWVIAPGLLYIALCFLANTLLDHKKNGVFIIILSVIIILVPAQSIDPSTVFFMNLATLTLLVYPTVALESYRKHYIYQALVLSILVLYLSVQQIDPSLTLNPINLSILFVSVIYSISLMSLIFSVIGKLEEITAHNIESEAMLLRSIDVLEKACCSRYDSLVSLENKTEELMRQQALIIQSEKLHSLLTLFKGLRRHIEKPLDKIYDLVEKIEDQDLPEGKLKVELQQVQKHISNITQTTTNFRKIGQSLNQGWEYVNIKDFIETTISLLKSACQEYCELDINYEGCQSTKLIPQQINSVFIEVINNNIEMAKEVHQDMPDGKEIKVYFSTDFNLHIYIENNFSHLVSSAEASKVLDPFFTLNENNIGLGMTLVFDIIEQHKGTIYLEKTQENTGLCHIQLPIRADN